MLSTCCGHPVAPETNRSRLLLTGYGPLDAALEELAQQPWLQILRVDPGQLMPGNLDEDEAHLAESGAGGKDFLVQTIGLEKYYQTRLKIILRVFHFATFQEWAASLNLFTGMMRTPWAIQMHPIGESLLFTVSFQYGREKCLPEIGSALQYSLHSIPL